MLRVFKFSVLLFLMAGMAGCSKTNNDPSLEIADESLSIELGSTQYVDIDTSDVESESDISWSVADTSVVEVDQSGLIEAVGGGSTEVKAKLNSDVSDTVTVEVTETVATISERQVQKVEEDDSYRLFLAFNNENDFQIADEADVAVEIVDSNEYEVFSDVMAIDESDFSNWSSGVDGEHYMASVEIPYNALEDVTSEEGTLTLSVETDDGDRFDEYDMTLDGLPADPHDVVYEWFSKNAKSGVDDDDQPYYYDSMSEEDRFDLEIRFYEDTTDVMLILENEMSSVFDDKLNATVDFNDMQSGIYTIFRSSYNNDMDYGYDDETFFDSSGEASIIFDSHTFDGYPDREQDLAESLTELAFLNLKKYMIENLGIIIDYQ